MNIEILEIEYEDIPDDVLYMKLREQDEKECLAINPCPVPITIKCSVEISEWAKVVRIDGKPVAVFGLANIPGASSIGVPWFLGTDAMDDIPITFARRARREVKEMLTGKYFLFNYVGVENTNAQRLLEFLGFTLNKDVKCTFHGDYEFYSFHLFRG